MGSSTDKYKVVIEDKERIVEDLKKMKMHMDPSSISLNDIVKKLRSEDPS